MDSHGKKKFDLAKYYITANKKEEQQEDIIRFEARTRTYGGARKSREERMLFEVCSTVCVAVVQQGGHLEPSQCQHTCSVCFSKDNTKVKIFPFLSKLFFIFEKF